MRRPGLFIACAGIALAPTQGVLGIDPPFPTTVELLGSSTYNTTDWDENNDGFGTIEMKDDVNGLLFNPEGTDDAVRTQFIPGFKVADGVGWAKFRLEVGDANNDTKDIAFYLGLYNDANDPFTTEPTQAAFFKKDSGTGE